VRRPTADAQVHEVATLDRSADDLARHPPRVRVHGARHRRDHVVVRQEGRGRQRDVMRVPPRRQRQGTEGSRGARWCSRWRGRGGGMPGRASGHRGHARDHDEVEDRRPHDDRCPYFSRTIEARWPGCGASTNTSS